MDTATAKDDVLREPVLFESLAFLGPRSQAQYTFCGGVAIFLNMDHESGGLARGLPWGLRDPGEVVVADMQCHAARAVRCKVPPP